MSALAHQRQEESLRTLQSATEQCRALTGRRLADRFDVGQVLGYGGSSIIFEGWHVVLRHPVAVKVLRVDYAADRELVNHFAQEAMVTAQMRSPHVVRVFDTGLIDDTVPFTVLELLRGQTLNELRRNGRAFSPEEAVDLVLQACRALDESHGRGIVHRDIKPDNLFLAELPDGSHVLKVIDFGVAKHGVSHTFLSEAWVGTPGYMAPEQITKPSAVDERADIWALGIVLFELLTGRSPFRGTNSEELLASTLRDEALPLEVAYQGLPFELYAAVQRCLAKDPEQRFRHVKELASQLVRVRERFNRGEELSTGIVRLPDNWDVRVTPPHGWTLPGPTVALKVPPNAPNVAARRRLSLSAGLVAGALFGITIGNTLIHPAAPPPASTGSDSVAAAGVNAEAELVVPPSERSESRESTESSEPSDAVVTTLAAERLPKPQVETSAALRLIPLSSNSALISTRLQAAQRPTSSTTPTPAAPGRVTSAGVATRQPPTAASAVKANSEFEELLTPWTRRAK